MSNAELLSLVEQYREVQQLIEAAQAEMNTIKATISAEMARRAACTTWENLCFFLYMPRRVFSSFFVSFFARFPGLCRRRKTCKNLYFFLYSLWPAENLRKPEISAYIVPSTSRRSAAGKRSFWRKVDQKLTIPVKSSPVGA